MKRENDRRSLTRRAFIKLAAAAGLLAGCRSPSQPDASPSAPAGTPIRVTTSTPTTAPTATPTATPIAAPTATPTPEPTTTLTPLPAVALRRPGIMQTYPDVPSKVVHARHPGVRVNGALVPEGLRHMLDASIVALTGLDDAAEAWRALFDPGERIAIKVNGHKRGAVHVPLAVALGECLQAAGIPGEQILIWDRSSRELEGEGYTVNKSGPGVRCHGTDGGYREGWTLLDGEIRLSELLLSYDALINLPILKVANGPGISFALKNHYGTFDRPSVYHRPRFGPAIAELNAIPAIRDRTRLVVGDLLTAEERRDTAGYRMMGTGDAILVSYDPVAHDAVGLRIATQLLEAEGSSTEATSSQATAWLENATALELGTHELNQIHWAEIAL